MQKKSSNSSDQRPRFTLSNQAVQRLQLAVKQHNDSIPPGAPKRTCSHLVEQLILDNVTDHTALQLKRLHELMQERVEHDKEIRQLQLVLKQKRAKTLKPGGERDLLLEEIEKLKDAAAKESDEWGAN